MRSSCTVPAGPRLGTRHASSTTKGLTCSAKAPQQCQSINSRSSSASSSNRWSGCCTPHGHSHGSSICLAASNGPFDPDVGPQKALAGDSSSSSKEGKASSWGSGWSKRSSSGSVFKKQQPLGSASQKAKPDSSTSPAAPAAAEHLDPQLEASIRMNVDRANQTLQEIVQVGTQQHGSSSSSCSSSIRLFLKA